MDFKNIVLTFSEKRILKWSRHHLVKVKYCKRLLRLKLVTETKTGTPGNMPVGTGLCKISDLGIDYLLHSKDLNRTRFTIPIIVSIIANIVISLIKPEIPLLLQHLQQLISKYLF